MKNKKIAFCQDLPFMHLDSGAESNDRNMVVYGLRNGFDIYAVSPNNIVVPKNTDLVVISNCVNFPRQAISKVCEEFPVVFFHHDFNFCNFRLFMPAVEKCKSCINRDFWLPLYQKAKLNVFLSPLHREAYFYVFPELRGMKNQAVIPSAIDIDEFKPVEGIERIPNTVVGVNSLLEFKGRDNVLTHAKEHPELKYTFVGSFDGEDDIPLPKNCEYVGYIPNPLLPETYSKYEYFIHLPSQKSPFDRTVAESKLCGCKIIGNENVGALSWPWMNGSVEDARFILGKAPIGFWEEVSKSMGWV